MIIEEHGAGVSAVCAVVIDREIRAPGQVLVTGRVLAFARDVEADLVTHGDVRRGRDLDIGVARLGIHQSSSDDTERRQSAHQFLMIHSHR